MDRIEFSSVSAKRRITREQWEEATEDRRQYWRERLDRFDLPETAK